MKKPKILAYCHPPCSPGIQELHMMLFDTLDILSRDYDMYVLCRDAEAYKFYQDVLCIKHPRVNIIRCSQARAEERRYVLGELEHEVSNAVHGDLEFEFAYWFSAGLACVTSEDLTREVYEKALLGKEHYVECDKTTLPVVQQADMLAFATKHCKKIVYRVIDYTEMHLENIVKGCPVKMLSFHDDEVRGHKKVHDVEAFHLCKEDLRNESMDKTYDFVFGYTVEIPERAYLSDFCFSHIKQDEKVKLYVKDKHYSRYAPIDTQLKSEDYLKQISHAKFSLIAPSTDKDEVSLIRVYEDISRRCVPLFMKDVKHWKVFDREMSKLIAEELTYDEEKHPSLNKFIQELDYEKLMSKIESCQMIKDARAKEVIYNMVRKEILEN